MIGGWSRQAGSLSLRSRSVTGCVPMEQELSLFCQTQN